MTERIAHRDADFAAELPVLSVEDAKLVTLARGAKARAGAAQGAAVRDDDGRTYAAAAVSLPSLELSALQAAVALAVSSAATGLEAAVVVGGPVGGARAVSGAMSGAMSGSGSVPLVDEASVAVARDLGTPLLIVTDAAGTVVERRLL